MLFGKLCNLFHPGGSHYHSPRFLKLPRVRFTFKSLGSGGDASGYKYTSSLCVYIYSVFMVHYTLDIGYGCICTSCLTANNYHIGHVLQELLPCSYIHWAAAMACISSTPPPHVRSLRMHQYALQSVGDELVQNRRTGEPSAKWKCPDQWLRSNDPHAMVVLGLWNRLILFQLTKC